MQLQPKFKATFSLHDEKNAKSIISLNIKIRRGKKYEKVATDCAFTQIIYKRYMILLRIFPNFEELL